MRIDKVFVSGAFTLATSYITKIVMISSQPSKIVCESVVSNSLCSLLNLCEKVSKLVCEEKPYEATNTEIALDVIFLSPLGFIVGYSISRIFDKYVFCNKIRS